MADITQALPPTDSVTASADWAKKNLFRFDGKSIHFRESPVDQWQHLQDLRGTSFEGNPDAFFSALPISVLSDKATNYRTRVETDPQFAQRVQTDLNRREASLRESRAAADPVAYLKETLGIDAPEVVQRELEYQDLVREQAQQSRQQFLDSADAFKRIAEGEGPSIAEQAGLQQRAGAMRDISSQALAGSRGRFNPALARAAVNAQSRVSGQLANQIALNKLQEQQAARNAYLTALGGAAGRDINLQQLGQQGAQFGQQYGMGVNQLGQNALGAFRDYSVSQGQLANQSRQLDLQKQAQDRSFWTDMADVAFGGMEGLGKTIGKISDIQHKEDIRSADKDLSQFLSSLGSHNYRYKKRVRGSKLAPSGRNISVMAQELEKSKHGKKLVLNTPVGKMVDYGKAAPITLASLAYLNKRLDRLEKRRGGK